MKFELLVKAYDPCFACSKVWEIPDFYVEHFKPVDFCDDPLSAAISGGVVKNSMQAGVIIRERKSAAEELAKELADAILEEMRKRDTYNGYKIEKEVHND